LQYLLDGGADAFPVWSAESPDFTGGAYTSEEQTLTGVDVADTDDDRGVHEKILHGLA
jgi:hypothetical protein